MTADRSEAVAALERLGLSNYEAKVFIALQLLGTGTARDVYRIGDIPRSQVYGAAERLEQRGLVEIQHSNPIQYRPVSLEEAESLLEERFEDERRRAFDFIEFERDRQNHQREEREEIWSITGRTHVDDRFVHLIDGADRSAIIGAKHPSLVGPAIEELVKEKGRAGIDVIVVSETPAVLDRFSGAVGIETVPLPESMRTDRAGRMLVVDGDTVLLSVLGSISPETGESDPEREAAIWSASSGFATVLATILTSWLETSVAVE